MKGRTMRAGWWMAIPALTLAVWLFAVGAVAWHGLGRRTNRIGEKLVRLVTNRGRAAQKPTVPYAGPVSMSDPRLSSLRQAAQSWKRSSRSVRAVVDQICLVPDAPAFLEAIASWDERHFFPILIDEPAWTLPFLRAFRPARVVRYVRRKPSLSPRLEPDAIDARDIPWSDALEAVSRAWSGRSGIAGALPDAGLPPRSLGVTPPGIVLSAPRAPMLAGAVALAAGRFQPLVRLPVTSERTDGASSWDVPRRFGDVLSLPQAWLFARKVERCVSFVIPAYERLGDDCDFLTIAEAWPYRYADDRSAEPVRGLFALDDLIGRRFELASRGAWLDHTRRRWAYTGRLLGGPAESVARAMGALFLQPASALLWNTYPPGEPWSDYSMDMAARELSELTRDATAVVQRTGRQSDLASWHRTVDPVNRFGLIMLNSWGGPDWFQISGGAGRPGDVPRGVPSAVAMIHSFSAADPTDPQTIAGRWLAQGAFAYFGAVYEPFLHAFRAPRLVVELMSAGVPMVAALRQGELEPFGFPWRLIYLGDPLYQIQATEISSGRPGIDEAVPARNTQRISPGDWSKAAPDEANWPVVEIASPGSESRLPEQGRDSESDDARFRWCVDASIGALVGPASSSARPSSAGAGDWLQVLRKIRRDRLTRALRPFFDDLLIDALEEAGLVDELATRLATIPPAERAPRVWQALETSAMTRLARLLAQGGKMSGFVKALDLWDDVMRLDWPKSSHFPAQFTERVGALSSNDAHCRRLWLGRLRRTGDAMAADPRRQAHAEVIAAERTRFEAAGGGPVASP